MKLKILQTGAPVLRQPATELGLAEIQSSAIQRLIALMKETMRDAPGVGLAAPQIGESLQLIVIEDREEYMQGLSAEQLAARERAPVPYHVIINPKLTLESADSRVFYEGCLSVAGFVGRVPRALEMKVEGFNEHAEPITLHARGWYARILQHEVDHLQGILYIDRMQMDSFAAIENFMKYGKAGT